MKNGKIISFVKAVDVEFLDGFINDGIVCMNPLKFFRDYEENFNDSNIGDKFEGAEIVCGNGFKVLFGDLIRTNNEDMEQIMKNAIEFKNCVDFRLTYEDDNVNILSLFAVTSDHIDRDTGQLIIPQRFKDEFRNHRFVLFLSPDSFIEKLKVEIEKEGFILSGGLVNYYELNELMIENLTYFDKPNSLSYQNEFRLMFKNIDNQQRLFTLGPFNDLCFEFDINKNLYIRMIDDKLFEISDVQYGN